MLVKVCGLKYQDNLDAISALDIDMIGLNFYKPSKRYLSATIDYTTLSADIKKVGVFVNEDYDKVLQLATLHGLDYVQLHGDEDVTYCKALHEKIKVIKVFRVKENIDYTLLKSFTFVDMFLLDTYTPKYGGSGIRFDWSLLKDYDLDVPFLLSGGISADDVESILALDIPQCIGVDINSKFESAPGLKDIALTKSFINSIKKTA